MRVAEGMKPIILEMKSGTAPTPVLAPDLALDPRAAALQVLCLADPAQKAAAAQALFGQVDAGAIEAGGLDAGIIDLHAVFNEPAALPGRPPLPRLVPPKAVPNRSPFTLEGRAALLHAITHIEFNAIKIASHSDVNAWTPMYA